jgi:hypothetical protein
MVDKFPEAAVSDGHVQEKGLLSIAPGEGKIPENILMTDNWDIDAFPMKHPDGKNGLHQSRERKLSDQYYFVQRLRNKDERFSSDPSYAFASAAYLEKKQLQRNINVSFNRGKKNITPAGEIKLVIHLLTGKLLNTRCRQNWKIWDPFNFSLLSVVQIVAGMRILVLFYET